MRRCSGRRLAEEVRLAGNRLVGEVPLEDSRLAVVDRLVEVLRDTVTDPVEVLLCLGVELGLGYMLDTAVVVGHLDLPEEVLQHLDHLDTVVDHLERLQVSKRVPC